MSSLCTSIIVVAVLPMLFCSANYIYQTINGTIVQDNIFDFSVKVEELIGVIFYSFDSEGNQFGIVVGKEHNEDKHVRITFNHECQSVHLKKFCGCDHCDNNFYEFQVVVKKLFMRIHCNNNRPLYQFFEILLGKFGSCDGVIYPVPTVMTGRNDSIFVMIGNIGPYIGENQVSIAPLEQQMVGCLEKFELNSETIKFSGGGSKVQQSCPQKCHRNICNNGQCRYGILYKIKCDCSLTSLNGLYCNRSLIEYNPAGFNSLKKHSFIKNVEIKMSWKPLINKTYCLIDIVGRNTNATILVKEGHLMMNSTIISSTDFSETNFVSINIWNSYLIIKTKYNATMMKFSIHKRALINIGFSRNKSTCDTFHGYYDLQYTDTELTPMDKNIEDTLNCTKRILKINGDKVGQQLEIDRTERNRFFSGNSIKPDSTGNTVRNVALINAAANILLVIVLIAICWRIRIGRRNATRNIYDSIEINTQNRARNSTNSRFYPYDG